MQREELIELGFTPTHYQGQEGEFLVLKTKIEMIESVRTMLAGDDYFEDGTEVIIDVCPGGQIQLYVSDADFHDNYPIDSDGGRALLAEAVAAAKMSKD